MSNPKTGENRLVPDIRPEHIETITETYTPEGGEVQTAEYKIFNVDGIIGNILNRMAFWRTHAKAVWYNKLANRTVADEIRDLNAKMVFSGISQVPFTSGVGIINHNCGFPDTNYNLIFTRTEGGAMFACGVKNIDGNNTEIQARSPNGTAIASVHNVTLSIGWMAIYNS